jgi:LCP family protein required for cell wall assembly
MQKIIIRVFICAFFLAGCSASQPQKSRPDNLPIMETIIEDAAKPPLTLALTPFQTNTPIGTPHVLPSPTPGTIVQLGLDKPDGQVNILLLGSDYRPKKGYRTDVIMVLSLNPDKGTATLTSFPRDLYVNIPGQGMNRINAAQEIGGFELTAATLEDIFDVTVDYYIMTNFSGFKNIVDTLGGITVYASEELTDTCDLPQAVDKICHISVGNNVMNGATALWYVRSRETTNDFDRTRRAQEVITAIFKKAMSLDAINRGPELYDLFITSVESNLMMEKILQLLPLSTKIFEDPSLVKRYAIGPENVTHYFVSDRNMMVLIPDPNSISEIIRQAFYQ